MKTRAAFVKTVTLELRYIVNVEVKDPHSPFPGVSETLVVQFIGSLLRHISNCRCGIVTYGAVVGIGVPESIQCIQWIGEGFMVVTAMESYVSLTCIDV